MVRTINRVRKAYNPSLDIQGIVLTMFDRRYNLSDSVALEVRDHFGEIVYGGVDWADESFARKSMELMAERVIPEVNKHINQ